MRLSPGLLLLVILMAACGSGGAGVPPPSGQDGRATNSSQPSSSTGAKPSAASAAASAPAQLVPVKISNIGVSGGVQPLWVAIEGGIFKKNGLDVASDTLTTSSAATVAALVSGQIQVAWTDGMSAVNARAGGGDVTVVATIHPAYSYLLETSPDIKKPEDLRGKKLAVSSLTGTDAVATKLALAKMGIDWQKDVTLVATGDNASRTAAVIGGSVQGTLQEPPGSLQLEDKGFHAVADLTPMNLPSVNASLIVSTPYLNQNRATAQKFIDSIVESIARVKKDKAFTVSVLKKYYKDAFDDKTMGIVYDYYLPNTPTLPYPKAELFSAGIQELSKENPKIKDVDVNKVIDPSLVQSAADRKLDS